MPNTLTTIDLRFPHDVVLSRQRARQISGLLGFDLLDQTRIATAVSELARNVTAYARNGRVEFLIEKDVNPSLVIRIEDDGPGIADLKAVLDGTFTSTTGAGVGIVGAKRLMDQFQIESNSSSGTTIILSKLLPIAVVDRIPERISFVINELAVRSPQDPFAEIQFQNRELLTVMNDLRSREEVLQRLNQELAETNRGVVALYSELDEKAEDLTRVSDLKSSFLSNMSHEFRTPLASILSLTGILLDRMDGELTEEQAKQITFIKTSADSLLSLVNDLLDLAKIEAGKIDVQPTAFYVPALFRTLQSTFRPLLEAGNVELTIDEPGDMPMLYTDEGKVSQILRNLVANAVKFTTSGTVRVYVQELSDKDVVIAVQDTGIGIAPENQELIFAEFVQVPSSGLTSKLGTGLGLPLSRRLAQLLGGDVSLKSALGAGSTFSVTIPLVYSGTNEVGHA